MSRGCRSHPKNKQELKRLKAVTLLKANVNRDLTMHITGISQATYYRVKDDMKKRRSWAKKSGFRFHFEAKKQDKQKLYNMILKNPFLSPKDIIKNL